MNGIRFVVVVLSISLLSNISIKQEEKQNVFFDEEIKVLNTSSIRNDDNPCLKISAIIPNDYLMNDNVEYGFISAPLLSIFDEKDFILSNTNVINHIVNQDEYFIENNNFVIKSFIDIERDNFNSNFAVRSYVKFDNNIYYSSQFVVFNYYRICEKLDFNNIDQENILTIAKKYKSLNDDGFKFELDSSKNTYKIIGTNELSLLTNSIIPMYYNGLIVDEIAANAFENNQILNTLFIPNTITTIGENAFKGCSSLSIYIDSDTFKEGWNIGFNPTFCPVYYNYQSSLKHSNRLEKEYMIKMDQYVYDLINAGSEAFNQENYPISKFHYSDAVMMSGLLDLYDVNNNPYYLNSAVDHMNKFINLSKGTWKYTPAGGQLDSIPGGDVLLRLTDITFNNKYKSLSSRMQDILVASHRIDCEGRNFYHKNNYPNQIWLDGLYMAMPYYTRYETKYNENTNYEDIYKQYKYVYDTMRNVENGLYYHGYDHSNEQQWSKSNTANPKCSLSFWGRAIGWLVASLSNVIDIMTPLNQEELNYKSFLEKMLKEAIESVYNYVDEKTGLFYQVIDMQDKEGNYLETSASSLICFATLKANRLGILSEKYYQLGLNTFKGLLDYKMSFDEKENRYVLKDINKVAGLSSDRNGTFEYYISESVVCDNAKGSGPLLMAYAELLR